MKPYVLNMITPELIRDFFELYLPQYTKTYDILKVAKNDLPNNITVTLIPSLRNKLVNAILRQSVSKNISVNLELFTSTSSTLFFSVTNNPSLESLWLMFLIENFGYFSVFEENDKIFLVKKAAFFKNLISSECVACTGPGKVATGIITKPKLAFIEAEKGINLRLSGLATGYYNGNYYCDKPFASANLCYFDEVSATTNDNLRILISDYVKKPKEAIKIF